MSKNASVIPPRQRVLSDHVKKRNRLLPPILASMGDKHQPFSWTREIAPEAIWIALLVDKYGLRQGADLARGLCLIADKSVSNESAPSFVRFSAFFELSNDQKKYIVENLSRSEYLRISSALYPFQMICPENPLSFLFENSRFDFLPIYKEELSATLQSLYDRLSKLSALTAAASTFVAVIQGKLRMPVEMLKKVESELLAIEGYPDTDAGKAAAGFFRAGAPMLLGEFGNPNPLPTHEMWLEIFWRDIGMIGDCVNRFEIEYEEIGDDRNSQLISGFRNIAKRDLKERLDSWKPDLNNIEPHQVISALLSRQVVLVLEFADAPAIWTPNTAPTLLRVMADVFISLAWICDDPVTRTKQFIEYGLGTIKLDIAQREKSLAEAPDQEDAELLRQIINVQKQWLATQRMEQFVEVNLGSWSGLNTRKMAEEAGYIDFYNYVYQPFSSSVHSNWAHIGQYNATFCDNPSHRPHWIGTVVEFEPDTYWLYLASKYLDKTFRRFDEFSGLKVGEPASFAFVVDTLNSWADQNEA